MKKKLSAAMMFMAAIALLNGCGQKSDEQKSDVQVQTQEEQVVSDNEAVSTAGTFGEQADGISALCDD